jgi:hypothetical protein
VASLNVLARESPDSQPPAMVRHGRRVEPDRDPVTVGRLSGVAWAQLFLAVFAALLTAALLAGFAGWLLLRDTGSTDTGGVSTQCAAELLTSRDPGSIACNDDDPVAVQQWLADH